MRACTVVRTDTGPSKCFKVNVGLHQRFVVCPLLFAVVVNIDVVSSEKRNVLPSELLYMAEFVRMAPTMDDVY